MTRYLLVLGVFCGLCGLPLLGGCEHELKHDSTTVTHTDGTQTREDTTVKREANGNVVTEQHRTNNP